MRFKAIEVMTKHVISVKNDTSIDEVLSLLLRHSISGIPVTDHEGHLQGVITEHDLLHMMVTPERQIKDVCDLWTTDVISVTEDTSLPDVAELFLETGVRRIPVVDEQGHLLGIVSRRDILRRICEIRIRLATEFEALKTAKQKKQTEATVS